MKTIKKGDVILFKNEGGFVANAISKVTNSEFVHVGIVFNTIDKTVYVAEARNKGFVIHYYKETELLNNPVFKIKRSSIKLKNVDKIITQYLGNDYGFLQILNILIYRYLRIKLPGDGVDTLICSEAVARVLWDCNEKINLAEEFDTPFDYITPAMINKSKFFKE